MDNASPGELKEKLENDGFAIIEKVFATQEVILLQELLSSTEANKPSFRKTADLFAIRRFLQEVPAAAQIIFSNKLKAIVAALFGNDYFVVKSIYFDKPGASNWFVSYHQDLTIAVDRKDNIIGFGPWTVKPGQFAVQPPLEILENIYTIRLHLDDTDENNGALRILPGSHKKAIFRPKTIEWKNETEVICNVPAGGVMIMRPLLLHASSRTVNGLRRRVIHLEFCNKELPAPLKWAERSAYEIV